MSEISNNTNNECTCGEDEVSVAWLSVSGLVTFILLTYGIFLCNFSDTILKKWNRVKPKRSTLNRVRAKSIMNTQQETKKLVKKKYEIRYSELKLQEQIGSGTFGSVYKGVWLGTTVAIKKPHKHIPQEHQDRFIEEVDLMSNLHHPNIVQFMGACIRGSNTCLVLEYLSRGNMHDFLRQKQNKININMVLRFAVDIARGMKYLHHRLGIIQRDLKPTNLLIDYSLNVKLCDFGLSRVFQGGDGNLTYCGTPYWTAPEVILQKNYCAKADVFSFSIVLWELITREAPYKGEAELEIAFAVATEGLRPKIPEYCPDDIKNLMTQGWDADPDKRPGFEEILERLYFIKKQTMELRDSVISTKQSSFSKNSTLNEDTALIKATSSSSNLMSTVSSFKIKKSKV